MGRFVNPDNSAFQVAINSQIYVDKTGILEYTNSVLDTKQGYICNSRPRRFGKSTTADMLTAYYSKGCDSETIFSSFKIAGDSNYKTHLNKYDVIHIDVQWFLSNSGDADNVVSYITKSVIEELNITYPELLPSEEVTLPDALSRIKDATGQKFIIIIDEWDVLIRDETANERVRGEYINFLRGMFKGTEPTKYIQLAYLTGILPIKKEKTQSALNNFDEFTMIEPGIFSPYFGFNEDEVSDLCIKYDRDFEKVKLWYDGYTLEGYHVYNPRAVVSLMSKGTFKSYWSSTGNYEMIVPLINMDFDGLKKAIIEMLSGANVEVDVTSFQNDTASFANKDDVLTYLIHLGYLAYDPKSETAFIPNEEIRQELIKATKRRNWDELISLQNKSLELLNATLDMDSEIVAKTIEKVHAEYTSVIQYNNENSLSCVLTIAYLGAVQYYFKPIRELPTGRGFADFVFIPRPEYSQDYPALVMELKWNKNAQTALQQIKDKKYPDSIMHYTGDIILVGINYDKKSREHQCYIEKFEKY